MKPQGLELSSVNTSQTFRIKQEQQYVLPLDKQLILCMYMYLAYSVLYRIIAMRHHI